MDSIRMRYLARHGSDRISAARALAEDLMEGDATRFKAGYSAENALLAAVEVFGLSKDEAATVGTRVIFETEGR
jgi:hypothetical protein